MLKNWIKIYLYHVRQNVFYNVLNIFGLSIGIAGLIFAILYWNDEHSYDSWNPRKDDTFFVVTDLGEGRVWGATAAPVGKILLHQVPEVSSYCYVNTWYLEEMLEVDGKKIVCDKIADVQSNFFDFFPYKFVNGSAKSALKPGTMVLSDDMAVKLFGTLDPVGQRVKYADKLFTVTGVYHITGKSAYMPEAVTCMIDAKLKETEDRWGHFSFGMYVTLKNSKQAKTVSKKIENLYYYNTTLLSAKNNGISPKEYVKRFGMARITLVPLSALRLNTLTQDIPEQSGNYSFLIIMAGLSVLMLLMSIANYINLTTASVLKRAKEVGVRKVFGATSRNIILQFITETIFTMTVATLMALVIVELSLPFYNQFLNKKLVLTGASFYVQIFGVFAGVVVLAGIFPALYVSNFKTIQVLKGNFIRGKQGTWIRNSILIVQFAIASFFTIGAYIVYTQVNHLLNKDKGFKADQVVQIFYRNPYDFKLPGFRELLSRKYDHVKDRILSIEGVKQVGVSSMAVGKGFTFESAYYHNGKQIPLQNMAVDFDVLSMFNVTLKEGRKLSNTLSSDTLNSVLLNEQAAALMSTRKPVGEWIKWDELKKLKVIGVLKDFHVDGPQRKIAPMAFFHYKTLPGMLQNAHAIYVKVSPDKIEEALSAMETLWNEDIDPGFPFDYDFVDRNYARTFAQYVQQRNLFSLLTVVVIIIALCGLFALASFSIQRRMKEIAIRKTLGADTITLLKEITWKYLLYCVAGFILAIVPAWLLLEKWLEDFAYRITINPVSFILLFFLLFLLTLIVVIGRAYKATRVHVAEYLKYE